MVYHRICQTLARAPGHTGLARRSLQYLHEHRDRFRLGINNGVDLVIPVIRKPERFPLVVAAVLLVLRQGKKGVEVLGERDLKVKHRDATREPELLSLDTTSWS